MGVKRRCIECERKRERCREVSPGVLVCPRCWKEFEYDVYLYEHLKEIE